MNTNEYFSVNATKKFTLNLLAGNEVLPSFSEFIAEVPPSIRVANQCGVIDINLESDIYKITKDSSHHLSEYLKAQNQKLDLLIGYMLSQFDDPISRFFSINFGGGGITFRHPQSINVGANCRLKIFLDDPMTAIYCYGTITKTSQREEVDGSEYYETGIQFSLIQEDDRDLLIRSALMEQQAQLKQRARFHQD